MTELPEKPPALCLRVLACYLDSDLNQHWAMDLWHIASRAHPMRVALGLVAGVIDCNSTANGKSASPGCAFTVGCVDGARK